MATIWYGTRSFQVEDESAASFLALAMKALRDGKPQTLSFRGDLGGPEVVLALSPGVPLHVEFDSPLDDVQRRAIKGEFTVETDVDGSLYIAVRQSEAVDEQGSDAV